MLNAQDKFAGSILDTLVSDTDKYLVDDIAHTWIERGGDAEGVFYLWHILQQRIKELSNGDI